MDLSKALTAKAGFYSAGLRSMVHYQYVIKRKLT